MSRPVTVKLCSNKTQWQVDIGRKIDLAACRGICDEVLADTPVVLIARFRGSDVSVYPSGRVLVSDIDDDEQAVELVLELTGER